MTKTEFSREELLKDYWGCVGHALEKNKDKDFIVTKTGSLTFVQANNHANVIFKAIQQVSNEFGYGVGLFLKDPIKIIPGLVGIMKSRNYCIPLDVNFPAETLQSMIDIADIKVILTDDHHYAKISTIIETSLKLINIDQLNYLEIVPNPKVEYLPEDIVQILFTSGSTGTPKGAVEDYRYLLRSAGLKFTSQGVEAKDRLIHLSTFTFSGTHTSVFAALLGGFTNYYYDIKEDGLAGLPGWMHKMKITRFQSTPTVFRSFVSVLGPTDTFPEIRKLTLGGEKRFPKDIEAIKTHFPNVKDLRLGFASTETQSVTAKSYPIDYDFGQENLPSGKVLGDIKLYIWDAEGKSLPDGEEGEIVVHGDSLARGYINNAELTNERFIPDPDQPGWQYFKTGDLGKLLPSGELVHLGRIDNMVKIKGVRIELSSIENHMLSYPGIIQVATKAFEDGNGNGRLAAYFVSEQGIKVPASDLRKFLAERLPRHLLPHYLISLEEIPLTQNGKVAFTMLPRPEMSRPELPNPYVPPENDLERKLVKIWEELIGVEGIGVTDDFFDLGGDSLVGVMVFAKIEEVLGRNLPVSILLTASSIRKQVKLIENRQVDQTFDPVIPVRTQGDRPPLFFVPGKAGYPTRIRHLAGKIDPGTPVYALQYLVRDSETGFRSIESIASYYLNAIKKIVPHGPYHFVGESMGGKIALEIARQLDKMGEKTIILALLDTYNSTESIPKVYIEKDKKLPYYWLLMRKHIFILWHSDWRGKLDYLRFYRKTGGAKIRELIFEPDNKKKVTRSSVLPEEMQQMEAANKIANNKYQAKPYPGRVILFKALRNANTKEESNGWSDVPLGELKIHPLDCYHGSILFDPAVSHLADILQDYIGEYVQQVG